MVVLNESTRRALISLSAVYRLMSSTASFTMETPKTKIKGAKVVEGLFSKQLQSSVLVSYGVLAVDQSSAKAPSGEQASMWRLNLRHRTDTQTG